MLKVVTARIARRIRAGDYQVRWGGEEFLVIAETTQKYAAALAEKLRQGIEEAPFEGVGKVTMSFGVCSGRIDENGRFEILLEKADRALYQAKERGRNRIVACDQ